MFGLHLMPPKIRIFLSKFGYTVDQTRLAESRKAYSMAATLQRKVPFWYQSTTELDL